MQFCIQLYMCITSLRIKLYTPILEIIWVIVHVLFRKKINHMNESVDQNKTTASSKCFAIYFFITRLFSKIAIIQGKHIHI